MKGSEQGKEAERKKEKKQSEEQSRGEKRKKETAEEQIVKTPQTRKAMKQTWTCIFFFFSLRAFLYLPIAQSTRLDHKLQSSAALAPSSFHLVLLVQWRGASALVARVLPWLVLHALLSMNPPAEVHVLERSFLPASRTRREKTLRELRLLRVQVRNRVGECSVAENRIGLSSRAATSTERVKAKVLDTSSWERCYPAPASYQAVMVGASGVVTSALLL